MLSTELHQQNGFDVEELPPTDDQGRPRTLVLEFDPPIHWNDNDYDKITLREPTGNMVMRAEGELGATWTAQSMRKYQLALISLASGELRQVVERMPISKVAEAFDFLNSFINPGRATGAS